MASNRATLKAFFETGDVPTQAQFAALIDGLMSVVDPDTVTGVKTFNSNIITDDDKVIKAKSGGGQIDLRAFGTNNVIFFSSDNGAGLQGWANVQFDGVDIGFGDFNTPANIKGEFVANTTFARLAFGGLPVIEIRLNKLGFFQASPVAKPTVTGSRAGNAALASLLTALASLGLITDSTTA